MFTLLKFVQRDCMHDVFADGRLTRCAEEGELWQCRRGKHHPPTPLRTRHCHDLTDAKRIKATAGVAVCAALLPLAPLLITLLISHSHAAKLMQPAQCMLFVERSSRLGSCASRARPGLHILAGQVLQDATVSCALLVDPNRTCLDAHKLV
jgi:hypothetical protein